MKVILRITTIYYHYFKVTLHFTAQCLGDDPQEGVVKGFPCYVLLPNITITTFLLPVTTSFSLLPIVVPGRDFPLL